MISLRFPIPIQNTLIPIKITKPKPFPSQNQSTNGKKQSSLVTPFSLPRFPKLLAASTNGKILAGDMPEGLSRELMPRHVAFVIEGNSRWARERGLPAAAGYMAGARSLRLLIDLCGRWGIKVLTISAADNRIESKVKIVEYLMMFFGGLLEPEIQNFKRKGFRLSVIGDLSNLPNSFRKIISDVEERTKDNTRLQLIVAVSYGGKYDIVQACKSIAQQVNDGTVPVEAICEALIEQELETKCTEFPYPDLLIRTDGEPTVNNFFLWQLAYTELFFVQTLWPDFGETKFIEALTSFQNRLKRYGGKCS